MKRKAVAFLALFSFACFLIGSIGFAATYVWKRGASTLAVSTEFGQTRDSTDGWKPLTSESSEEEQTFDSSDISRFSLRTDLAKLQFVTSPSDTITVRLTSQSSDKYKPEIKAEQRGDHLSVEVLHPEQTGFGLDRIQDLLQNNNNQSLTMTVEVALPDKVFSEVRLQSDMGSIALGGMKADKLHIRSDAGSVHLNDYVGKKLEVNTNIGSIQLKEIDAEINVSSDIGSISVEQSSILHPLNIKNEIGKVELIVSKVAPMTMELTTSMGSIHTNLPGMTEEERRRTYWKGSYGNNGPSVKINTEIGSISVLSK